MGDRDRQILMLIEFLADDYIASRFRLPEFCDRLDSLVADLDSAELRQAFSAPLAALREVRDIILNGVHHSSDMRLEAWAIRKTRQIAHGFVERRSPSGASA